MRNKIVFFLLFLATVAVAVFSGSEFSRFLLGFEFLLAIALFACARLMKRRVGATMRPPMAQARRGQEIPLEVELENRSSLPVPEVRAMVNCRDHYDGTVLPLRGTAMLDGKDQTVLRFTVRAQHYGLLTVWGGKIQVGDPLGVNYPTIRFPERKWEIAVLPELAAAAGEQDAPGDPRQMVEGGENISGRGSDPAAAYELRKYQNGEPLRNIHWKISAKTDELMVKEFGRNTEPMTVVFLDLDRGGKAYSREDWDRFLETVASFAAQQLQADASFQLVWLEEQGGLVQSQVRDESSARAALTALLRTGPYTAATGQIAYKEKLKHETYNGTIRIDLWCGITREQTR